MTNANHFDRIRKCRVVPVLTIHDADQSLDIAKALIAGGVDILEVTLRTPAGLEAIRRIKAAGLDCLCGAGTVTTLEDIQACKDAGADFLVTPATPAGLIDALKAYPGLVLPGCATPTEALSLYQHGFEVVKFFPAEPAGGAPMLKALSAPLPKIKFMPTGGISLKNMGTYLSLPNVLAVGGSWLCTDKDAESSDWDAITAKSIEARKTV